MLKLKNQDEYYVEMVCGKSDTVLNRFRPLEIPISILPLKGITDRDSPKRFKRLLKRGQNIIHVHSFSDAVTAVLNPIEGLSEEDIEAGEDYFSVMRKNLEALQKALNASSSYSCMVFSSCFRLGAVRYRYLVPE